MTEKLFETNSLLKTCTAVVMSCIEKNNKYLIELDKTVFFPEGGGQLSDKGKIGSAIVSHVTEKDGRIYHECDKPLDPGSTVDAEIDWQVRLDRMQQHSGEHILSYALWKLFRAANIGFHMNENTVTIDLDKELSDEQLLEAEHLANEIVWDNRPVTVQYMDSSQALMLKDRMRKFNDKLTGILRIVSVEGADVCTCCGTHPPATGMVGSIKIIRREKHKTGCRIEFLCGRRALLDADNKNALVMHIANSFSSKPEQIMSHLARQEEEVTLLKEKLHRLTGIAFEKQISEALAEAPTCANGARLIAIALPDAEGKDSKQLLPMVSTLANTVSIIMIANPERISYIAALGPCTPGSCQQYIRLLNDEFGGRGGGKPECAQGGSAYCEDWQEKLKIVIQKIQAL